MPKKIIIFIFLILVLAGVFFVYKFVYKDKSNYCSKYACFVEVEISEEEYNKKLELIKEAKENIKKDPKNLDNYLSLGLYYKSLGELDKAKNAYLDGLKVNDEFYLFYLNLGNILVDMRDYESAKEFYLKAIENKAVEPNSYLKLVDLLVSQIKAPDKEIREVYLEGLKNTGGDLNICKSYASYLEEIKEYGPAANTWRICLLQDSGNEAIKEKIEELKNKNSE
ncbi:MAG: hypothetical protein PHR36_01885 [Patescibacteria group bacterium]|nr:hypothetical protein [Patescibacteria group bacterium]